MDSFIDWFTLRFAVEVLLDGFVKATLILGLAWIVTRSLHRASAAVRHGVWSLALVGLLLLPVLSVVLPAWNVYLPERVAVLLASEAPTVASGVAVRSESPSMGLHGIQDTEVPRSAGRASGSAERALPEEASGQVSKGWSGLLALWVVGLWGAGALAWTGRFLLHVARISRLTRHADLLHADPRADMARALIRRLGIRRPVRVLCSPEVPMAMTWGLVRPVILMPYTARAWSDERFEVVLLHELAHVRRWDYAFHLAAQVVRALYWFNPLAWLAARRLYAEQERACDDLVLRSGMRACEYATHLLDLTRAALRRDATWQGSIAMARRSTMKERMRAILNTRSNRSALSWKAGLMVVSMGTGLVLPLASVQPAGVVRDLDAVWTLTSHLQADDPAVWQAAARATEVPVPHLAALLRHEDDAVRSRAAWALGNRGAPEARPALLLALEDADAAVRVQAVRALGKLGDRQALPHLMAALHDACPGVRTAALVAVKQICRCHALEAAPPALSDPDAAVRVTAAYVLGEAIRSMRNDGTAGDLKALRRYAPAVVAALQASLKDENAVVRRHATYALGELHDEAALEPLEAALQDRSATVRSEAARALGKLGGSCAVQALRLTLQDNHPDVRAVAATALAHLGA